MKCGCRYTSRDEDEHLEDEDVQFVLFKQPPNVDEDVDVDIHLGDEDVHLGDEDVHPGDEDVQFVLFKQPPHVDEDVDIDTHLGDEDVHLGDEDVLFVLERVRVRESDRESE